jgi:transposase-like protein
MNVHQNARLTPFRRRDLVTRLEQGEAVSSVARQLGISARTAHQWRRRFGRDGISGLYDRSSRPPRHPCQTAPAIALGIKVLRQQRWTCRQIGAAVGVSGATAARILRRAGLSRRGRFEPPPAISVTRIRARASCYTSTRRNSAGSPASAIASSAARRASTVRPALAGSTCTSPLTTTRAWRTSSCCPMIGRSPSGRVSVARCGGFERAASGSGACSPTMAPATARPASARRAAHSLSSTAARVRIPPRTNGKAERFIQSALREWAYARPYYTSADRARLLPGWLEHYNCARPHAGLAGLPPMTRLPDGNNLLRCHS